MTEALIALVALTLMEIVLGIDNIVFIVILTGRLPKEQQKLGRRVGLLAAMGMRVVLLGVPHRDPGLDEPTLSADRSGHSRPTGSAATRRSSACPSAI